MSRNSLIRAVNWLAVCALLAVPALADTPAAQKPATKKTVHHTSTSSSATKKHSTTSSKTSLSSAKHSSSKGKHSGKKSKSARKHGQQVIDSERTREIQEALIREHYLDGKPSGAWDASTQAAMQRYQAAQGWQSKTTPDSRALIKLGLGPSPEHLLNPESAMTSATLKSENAANSDPPAKTSPKPAPDPATPAKNSADTPQQ